MTRIAAVKTGNGKTALWFDAKDLDIKPGQKVVVETARGVEFGSLEKNIFEASDEEIKNLNSELKPVMRIATKRDIDRAKEMEQRGKEALPIFMKLAAETNEDMNPIMVEYLLDGRKAIFYFSAPERQDFRDLIKKLSSEFKLRVDMRQINEREKSALVSGIGFCGQELCCARLGRCPKHVSIKQAKAQGLALNPENISGMCGKLLCCLDYEYEDYKKFVDKAPKLKAKIETPEGIASVVDVNMPKEYVEIKLDDSEKRVKIPLVDMETDKHLAKKNAGAEVENPRPNKVSKEAWDKATSENYVLSLESVYTSTTLEGSEKLATGVVKTLPTKKRRMSKVVNTNNNDKHENKKPRRKSHNKHSNMKHNNASSGNVYEQNNSTTVRRRSRKIDSGGVRPGQNSSGLSKH